MMIARLPLAILLLTKCILSATETSVAIEEFRIAIAQGSAGTRIGSCMFEFSSVP